LIESHTPVGWNGIVVDVGPTVLILKRSGPIVVQGYAFVFELM